MNNQQKQALQWALQEMQKNQQNKPWFKKQWLNGLLSALVAFAAALISASCTSFII